MLSSRGQNLALIALFVPYWGTSLTKMLRDLWWSEEGGGFAQSRYPFRRRGSVVLVLETLGNETRVRLEVSKPDVMCLNRRKLLSLTLTVSGLVAGVHREKLLY